MDSITDAVALVSMDVEPEAGDTETTAADSGEGEGDATEEEEGEEGGTLSQDEIEMMVDIIDAEDGAMDGKARNEIL